VCPLACRIPAYTQNRVSIATAYASQPKTECTVRRGSPPYPFLDSRPIRVRYPTRLAFFYKGHPLSAAATPGILRGVCAWLSSQNLPDAGVCTCGKWRTANHRRSCTYYPGKCAHCVGSCFATSSATPSIQLLNRFRFKQGLPHLPPMHVA